MSLEVKPVGFVKKLSNGRSSITFLKKYVHCLEQIESFSHLVILCWMNRVPKELRRDLKVKPRHMNAPTLGVFATRFPARPNPIGVTTVKLLLRKDDSLVVEGLDAEDNTPVIDVKPYIPVFDKPSWRVKLPWWVLKHLKNHDHQHPSSFKEILKLVELE